MVFVGFQELYPICRGDVVLIKKDPIWIAGGTAMPFCQKCGREVADDDAYCSHCGVAVGLVEETYDVAADSLIERVKGFIHEGNVNRIIVKNEAGDVLLEIPVTVGVIGVLLAPWLAALGAITALVTRCTIVVQRKPE
jgi:hypothetical protein